MNPNSQTHKLTYSQTHLLTYSQTHLFTNSQKPIALPAPEIKKFSGIYS